MERNRVLRNRMKTALLLLVSLHLYLTNVAASSSQQPARCKTDYDVCVIGAGGSGAYTAAQLKRMGRSVLVLEKSQKVGGHCDVYVDPKTQYPVDVGVQVYINDPVVTETFALFNLSSLLVPYYNGVQSAIPLSVSPVNKGWVSNGFIPPPNVTALMQAVQLWFGLFQTRFAFLDTPNGAMPDFTKVPNDMMQILEAPFGDLLDSLNKEFEPQYGPNALRPLEEVTLTVVLQGPGPYREIPALKVLRTLRPAIVSALLQSDPAQGGGYSVQGGCIQIYRAFESYLGSAVKLDVPYIKMERKSDSVRVWYRQSGAPRTVYTTCRRVVVSATQSLANMKALFRDLDDREKNVFGQVTYSIYAPAVIASPPTNATSGINISPNLTSADLPNCIGAASFGPLGLGLSWALKLAPSLNTAQARFLIANSLDDFTRVSNGLFAAPKKPSQMFLYGPKAHQYDPRPADPRSYRSFFKDLYDLQGYRNTYYTGALLSYNGQHDVWRYSKWLLENNKWTC